MTTPRFDVVTDAIIERLSEDATLGALLARTVYGDGTGPAIYPAWPPPTAALPYVYAPAGSVQDDPWDPAPAARFRDIEREVHCYAARPNQGGGSPALVNTIASRVRALFHGVEIDLPHTGAEARNLRCLLSGPVINDGEHAFGRVLTLRLRIQSAVPAGEGGS